MTDCMLNDLRLARSGDKAASERLVEENSGLISEEHTSELQSR